MDVIETVKYHNNSLKLRFFIWIGNILRIIDGLINVLTLGTLRGNLQMLWLTSKPVQKERYGE